MYNISCEQTKIQIDDLGFIRNWECEDQIVSNPSYMVFFKDYSRLDPFCRSWDTSQSICDVIHDDATISYTKKIESIEISSNITANPKGWDWKIEIQGEYPQGHRFGVAVGSVPGSIGTIDKTISTTVSQYFRSSQEVFRDQTFLELPILFHKSDSLFAVFANMQTDCQFFTYDDQGPFIRATVSTCLTNKITISARIAENIDCLKSMFIDLYPKADIYLNKWKPIFKNICKQHKIEIVYQHDIHDSPHENINMKPLDENKLDKYAAITKEELSKYPSGFLCDAGIEGILLCGDLFINDRKASGSLQVNGIFFGHMTWIIWDVTQYNRWILHHEIFHAISKLIDIETGGFSLLSMPSADPIEHAADLFAIMMTDQRRANDLSRQHEWCRKQSNNIISTLHIDALCCNSSIASLDERVIWAVRQNESTQIMFGEMPNFSDLVEFRTELEYE